MRQRSRSETRLSSQRVFEVRVFQVRVDDVRLPNGRETSREVVDHSASVTVVPVDADANVLLVRQYRYPVDESLLELLAGGVEANETPEEAAQRELKEEIGHGAGRLRSLGRFWMSPGYCTELMHAYLATDLQPDTLAPDWDEDIEVERVRLSDVPGLIERGEIRDAKTMAALLMAVDLLEQG